MSSLSVRFFNSFKSKYLNFFFYLFDCQVSYALLSLRTVFRLCLLSRLPSWDVLRSRWLHPILVAQTLGWSVWMDSNHRPRAYQARALATWATDRFLSGYSVRPSLKVLPLMVEMKGFEPLTPCLQGRCSPNWATPPFIGFVLRTLNWILTIEQQNLSVQHVIHIYQVFCPNLTTKSQERLALLASRSP